MKSLKKYLKDMFGRELTENELIVLRIAYSTGEQDTFDRIAEKSHIK